MFSWEIHHPVYRLGSIDSTKFSTEYIHTIAAGSQNKVRVLPSRIRGETDNWTQATTNHSP